MRLIDADKMRENLLWCKEQSGSYNDVYWDDVIERLDGQPTVGCWISVKDRLPEESGNVLVCVKLDYADGARYVQMCHYSAYKKRFGCFDTLENSGFPKFGVVTHWMPLPELPKE